MSYSTFHATGTGVSRLCVLKGGQEAAHASPATCYLKSAYEAHLLELPISGADADFPAVVDTLIDSGHAVLLGAKVQVHVVLERLDADAGAIQQHLQAVQGVGPGPHTVK